MADNEFEVESVGQVYAQALINLAQQQNVLGEVTEDIHSLKALRESDEAFARFLGAVTIPEDEKIQTLAKIFTGRVHPLTLQTLNAMARRERLVFLPGLFLAFDDILARLAGRVDAELTSAQPLAEATLNRIREAVSRSTGKTPEITVKVDPALIGGMRLRIGDTLIDGSVETQLEKLQEQLRNAGAVQQRLGSVTA